MGEWRQTGREARCRQSAGSRVNDLERFFAGNKGGKIHKWKHYFEVYDRHFARFRGTEVHVVEVGVAHGGSLRMWRDYFGRKAHIYGVDVQPDTKAFEDERIRIILGDQSDPAFLRSLVAQIPRIDILIDDGGHTMYQQEVTFKTVFPHVSPNGVYLCEDLHTSYWGDFGGGYKRDGTFIELAKSLVDQINAWHSHSPELVVSDFTRSAYSLNFYDSILVIEKRPIEPPEVVMSGVDTLAWSDLPAPWPLNSAQLRPSAAKRIARRVPGYGTVARAIRRRKPAWP
jgi:23S rRNA U2552 (ribose-2'-O)-methylase RlmE/FtsJ